MNSGGRGETHALDDAASALRHASGLVYPRLWLVVRRQRKAAGHHPLVTCAHHVAVGSLTWFWSRQAGDSADHNLLQPSFASKTPRRPRLRARPARPG